MSNLVFPALPGVDIAVTRTPLYATSIQGSLSGKELRSTWETYPRYKYDLTFNFLRSAASYSEFQSLFGFVARHAGQYDSFLWTDPEDCALTAHPFGLGNGSATAFQLQRTLVPPASLNVPASRTYWPGFGDGYEPIWEPNTVGDAVYVGGVLTSATHGANGLVTLATPPGNGVVLTWTGTYYKRVRFASDTMTAERIVNAIWKTGQVTLMSVKP